MFCKDCKFFTPTYSIAGTCSLALPPYMPRPYDTNVSLESGCDFGQAQVTKRRPRKLVEESGDADE
jgi:hypothetical protein